MEVIRCRICKNEKLDNFLQLGPTPLANNFLKNEQLNLSENIYPLDLCFCENCGLVQLSYVVPPELMFKNYLWVSGISDTIPKHFQQLAKEASKVIKTNGNSLIIDIGSNDGTLLKCFMNLGLRVLGVEPATNIAEIAKKNGVETLNDFFNESTAVKIVKDKGKSKIITATNVVAHIDDLDGLLKGVSILLEDNGVFVIEVPYLLDMIEENEFDTVYHEHLSYFAIRPLVELLKNHNMEIFDIKRFPVHGGGIRVYVKRHYAKIPVTGTVKKFLENEEKFRLHTLDTYKKFAERIKTLRDNLVLLLKHLRSSGKKIVGYGAAAKGNTLLNYYKIDKNILDYIADKNKLKQGLYSPGMHIPVVSSEKILEDKPDYVLILAWNFADEIIKQQEKYRAIGGKFIIPIPEIKII